MRVKRSVKVIVWRSPINPEDREHYRDCLHLDHEPDDLCPRRYRATVEMCEYHPHRFNIPASRVVFPPWHVAYIPHGRQGQSLEALGAAVARGADEAWLAW